ncbi:hypothetical protein GCM10027072_56810 [Streptomyces bullii]
MCPSGLERALQTDAVFRAVVQETHRRRAVCGLLREGGGSGSAGDEDLRVRSCVVPGLLQTAAYVRAVTLAMNPYAADEYIEEKVSVLVVGAAAGAEFIRTVGADGG